DRILLVRIIITYCCCFFFSSRRRHTRCYRDWSSDVCSSDLGERKHADARGIERHRRVEWLREAEAKAGRVERVRGAESRAGGVRSEERRVGEARRCRVWVTGQKT